MNEKGKYSRIRCDNFLVELTRPELSSYAQMYVFSHSLTIPDVSFCHSRRLSSTSLIEDLFKE